jgi:hypothetical protein
MTFPGPEVTHRWQSRTLVDHNGRPLGSVVVDPIDDRGPIEANSLLPRHVAVAVS